MADFAIHPHADGRDSPAGGVICIGNNAVGRPRQRTLLPSSVARYWKRERGGDGESGWVRRISPFRRRGWWSPSPGWGCWGLIFGLTAAVAVLLVHGWGRGVMEDIPGGYVGAGAGTHDPMAALERWVDPVYAAARLRVFVYDLPEVYNVEQVRESHTNPPLTRDPICDTSFYSAEVSLHRFFLQSEVRTLQPDEADFFYVPIYATCFLMMHLPTNLTQTGEHYMRGMQHVINEVRASAGFADERGEMRE